MSIVVVGPARRSAYVRALCALTTGLWGLAAGPQAAVPQGGGGPGDWTLEFVVTSALSQSPLVEASRARGDAARGARAAAGTFPNPVGTFWRENAGYPGQSLPDTLSPETSLYLTLPLEPLFQRGSRVRRADEEVRTLEASLKLARRRVAADSARAFFHVALAQALAEEAEENRDRLDQLAGYIGVRVREGVTAEAELLRLRVERDQATTTVVVADVELTRRRAELTLYVMEPAARPESGPLRVAVPDLAAPAAAAIPPLSELLVRARAARAELVVERARLAGAEAAVEVERSLKLRQLGATFGNKHTEGRNTLIAGVSVSVPLFDRNQGGVARATAERLAADQDLAWAERLVAADVEGAHGAAIRLARQLADLQASFLARAEQVHQLTLGAYQEGGATLLQLLDATRMLADARLTYARVLFAQRQSLFELALSTGAEPAEAIDLLRAWSGAQPATASKGGAS
jgi:cobalt-zinc-cadmium efflux system outer membrane protein